MNPSNSKDPEQLLSIARHENGQVVAQLLEIYRNYLTVLAKVHIDRRLRAKVGGSDLVQETLIQAHQDFAEFQGTTEAELIQWLRKIMATKGAKLVRRYFVAQRRNVHLEQELCEDLNKSSLAMDRLPVSPDSSPSQQAARRECAVVLADALTQLPDDYREVMILHHLEGLTMAEVAKRMGKTIKSVQGLWARALIKLRPLMKGHL